MYESRDGQFRVENPYRQERQRPVWHLLHADTAEIGGWAWWQTYATKAEAQRRATV